MSEHRIKKIIIATLCSLVTATGYADDTDIFLGKNSAGAQGVAPSNLFFLLDTSSSMSWTLATEPGNPEIKMDILKDAMTDILSVKGVDDTLRNINVGIGTFYSPAGLVTYPILPIDGTGINGGTVRDEVITLVNGLNWDNSWGTPLASAYYESMAYIMGKPVLFGLSARDFGGWVDRGFRGEELSHISTYDDSVPPIYNFADFATQACSSNSILLLSDGQATVQGYQQMRDADPDTMDALAVDATDGLPCDASWGQFERCGRELADYAFNRMDTTNVDAPPIHTHTIGFDIAEDSAAEQYLEDVANEGGGQYFRVGNKDQLINAFLNVTNRVVETTSAFSPPAVTVDTQNRLYSGDSVFLNLFATERKPIWHGNVKKFNLCSSEDTGCDVGQYLGSNDQVAVDDNGNLLNSNVGDVWDESSAPAASNVLSGGLASKIADWQTRSIYTWTAEDYPTSVDSAEDVSARGWDLYEIDVTKEYLQGGAEPDLTNTVDTSDAIGRLRKRLYQAHNHCDANGAIDSDCMDELVKYLLGGRTRDSQVEGVDADNHWPIADIMHNEIKIVPFGKTSDDEAINKIVFGTNDGGLHVHDAATGLEHYTIYPQEVLDKLDSLEAAEDGSEHIYGLDGSASFRIRDVDQDYVIEPEDGDFVHFYIGMRRGGYNYYAFNLTPDTTLTTHTAEPGDPELLWVIRGTTDSTDPFYRLGQTWSAPKYTTMLVQDGSELVSKSVIVFGGGYDPDVEDVEGSFGANVATGSNLGNAIYIVDANTGEAIWWASSDYSADSGVTGLQVDDMVTGIVGDINLVDSNNDRRTDRLYAVDLSGQIWRVDLDSDMDNNSVGRLAVLSESGDPSDPEDNEDERKFFYEPDFVRVQDSNFSNGTSGADTYDAIAVVSGNRANPIDSTVNNRAYVVRDYLDDERLHPLGSASPTNYPACNPEGTGGCSVTGSITESGLFDVSNTILSPDSVDPSDSSVQAIAKSNGYYFSLLGDSEIGFSRTQVLAGSMYFTTYNSSDGPSVTEETVDGVTQCKVELGEANLYVVDLNSGSPLALDSSTQTPESRAFYIGRNPVTRAVPTVSRSETGTSLLKATFQAGAKLPPDPNEKELSFHPTFWYQQ